MSTKHKMRTVLQYGDPDIGAEIECEILFAFYPGRAASYYGDTPHPDEPAQIDFHRAEPFCNGKPAPFAGPDAGTQMACLNELAEAWFATDEGQTEAFATVRADDERAREYAAELRREP